MYFRSHPVSTTPNAPYIHLNHESILELWQTFPNGSVHALRILYGQIQENDYYPHAAFVQAL